MKAEEQVSELQEKVAALTSENDRLSQQVQDIAEALGCKEKPSHRHSHGRCIFIPLQALLDKANYGGEPPSIENGGLGFGVIDAALASPSAAWERSKREFAAEQKTDFIRQFCNDHNEKVRWLRGVALSEEHLLQQILDWFDAAALRAQGE